MRLKIWIGIALACLIGVSPVVLAQSTTADEQQLMQLERDWAQAR